MLHADWSIRLEKNRPVHNSQQIKQFGGYAPRGSIEALKFISLELPKLMTGKPETTAKKKLSYSKQCFGYGHGL